MKSRSTSPFNKKQQHKISNSKSVITVSTSYIKSYSEPIYKLSQRNSEALSK